MITSPPILIYRPATTADKDAADLARDADLTITRYVNDHDQVVYDLVNEDGDCEIRIIVKE